MQTVLITGANRGIGLSLAKLHAQRGDRVIGACRTASDALRATGAQVEAGVDVTDDKAVAALSERLGDATINRLWLNAGILGRERLGEVDPESLRRQFEVNAIGPLRVAQALMGRLAVGAKIGILTSRMGSVTDNGSGGYYGYRASKAAVNAIGKSLSIDLRPRGVSVFLLHPGYVATDMVGGSGDISADTAAERLVALLDRLGLAESGSFRHSDGSELPW